MTVLARIPFCHHDPNHRPTEFAPGDSLEKLPSSTIQDLCHRGYGIEVADLDAFRKSLETIAPYSEEFALAEMDIP